MKRLKYASAADRDHGVFGARCRFFWLLAPATAPAPAIEWLARSSTLVRPSQTPNLTAAQWAKTPLDRPKPFL